MNNIATSPELLLAAGISTADPAREYGLAEMTKINQKFASSAYDLACRHALLSHFADEINERFLGKDNCPTETAYEFSGRAWKEMEFIEQAIGKTPPRNLRDVCGHIAAVIAIIAARLNRKVLEKEIEAEYCQIDKILLGILEIVAASAGVAKADILPAFDVDRAEKEWGAKIIPELAEHGAAIADVQLQALSNEFRRRYAEFLDAPDGCDDEAEEHMEKLSARYWECGDALEKTAASGLAGLAAKASIVKEHLDISESAYSGMALSLADDCLRLAASLQSNYRGNPGSSDEEPAKETT